MQLKLIDIKKENKDCFSLIFEKPLNFNFYPGQFIDIQTNSGSRTFTIASSPTEKFLMITTRKGISDFKKSMEKLKKGDFVQISHPAGTFILDESSPAVFIAGGIGITPFRSMVKYAFDQELKTPITLIYSNPDENFLFKDELDNWQKGLRNLKIVYVNTGRQDRLDKNKLELFINRKSLIINPIYYLAGSQSMVYDISKQLSNSGIDEINIRTDSFDGYE